MASDGKDIPKRLTVKGERTRAAILDVAERQFAERGYDGVSLRQITDAAGVQMGQLQYYFPTKDEVFAGVLDRRQDEVMVGYARAVERLEAQGRAGEADLTAIVKAITAISRAWLTSDDIGRHRYLRMLGLATMNFSQPEFVRRHGEAFHPLNNRIIAFFSPLFPQATQHHIQSAYYFAEAQLLSLYLNLDAIFVRTGEVRTGDAVHRVYDELETFLIGGIERLLHTPPSN